MSKPSRTTADTPSLPPAGEEATATTAAVPAAGAHAGESTNLGNEHLLGALLQRQRQENVALAVASRLPGAAMLQPAALDYSALVAHPLGLGSAGGLALPVDLYLAAAHHEQQQQHLLSGISHSTVLDLAQHRPDLLALLQLPVAQQPLTRTNPRTLEAASALASLVPMKRQRSGERQEGEDTTETSKHVDSKAIPAQSSSTPSISRPRKRVMFLGDTGQASTDDIDGYTDDESEAWTMAMHRSFVKAIYETGTRHASPSVLLDHMVNMDDFPLTSERVKSRLQKYRNNSDKALAEFMQEYDAFLQRALSIGRQSTGSATSLLPLAKVLLILGQEEPLYGGDAAAALTYNILFKQSLGKSVATSRGGEGEFGNVVDRMLTPASLRNNSFEFTAQCHGQKLLVPQLTEEEKATPLGASFEHIRGTFASLITELKRQRGQGASDEARQEEPDPEIDDKKPKAVDTHLGSKVVHSKKQGEGSEEDASNASADKKKDEISSIVAQMYQHKFNRSENH